MSDLIVSNPVDTFMRSTTPAAMRAAVGLGSALFNVQDAAYGAKGDGRVFRDGATSGTTLTAASITALDNGKTVVIETSSTTRVVRTISSATSGSCSLSASVSTVSGATCYLGTDDTTAIQAAITAAYNAGGGVVFLPTGLYILAGPLQEGSGRNSILLLPNPNTVTSEQIRTVVLRGETPANTGYSGFFSYPVSQNGTVLYFSDANQTGTNPSAICGNAAGSWSSVNFGLFDINIRLPRNPGIDALNLENAGTFLPNNVTFDTDKANQSTATLPTTTTTALRLPGNGNNAWIPMTNVWIQGFGVGARTSDVATFYNVTFAQNSVGLYIGEGTPTNIFGAHFAANQVNIKSVQTGYPAIFGFGVVFESDGVTTTHIDDAGGKLLGYLGLLTSDPLLNFNSTQLRIDSAGTQTRSSFGALAYLCYQNNLLSLQPAATNGISGILLMASNGTPIGQLIGAEQFSEFAFQAKAGFNLYCTNSDGHGLKIPDGGSGDPTATNGNLVLATAGKGVVFNPVTVATLPVSPTNYQEVMVTDANSPTLGATVAGGGSTLVKVAWNGSAWKVV